MSENQKSWDIAIAEKFKERDNPKPIGAVLGKVLRPLPDISIELLGGYGILDTDKIYLSNAITNRLAIECTMKDYESQDNTFISGKTNFKVSIDNLSTSGTGSTEKGGAVLTLSQSGSIKSMQIPTLHNEKENKTKGKFILQTVFNLIPGMYVLVIPNYEEDKFFVVDVFNYAPEVSLEWEYYQK